MIEDWRSRLKRDIGWLLLFKFGLLATLWACFFSNSQQLRVDASVTADRLALTHGGKPP